MTGVYLDSAATAPMDPAALETYVSCSRMYAGNPSSVHAAGRDAAERLQEARRSIAQCLGADSGEIFFTSGGTEANNWACRIAATAGAAAGKRHIIASAIEHPSVLRPLEQLRKAGFEVTLLPVPSDGVVRVSDLLSALREDTVLVSVMAVNHELGTIQPVSALGALCRARGILFHTDAVQAAGHIPINLREMPVDLLSLSAHKFSGPKGVGALFCKAGVPMTALFRGGGQEAGFRAGTENLPAIAAMETALRNSVSRLAGTELPRRSERFLQKITAIPGVSLNGDRTRCLPGIVNVRFGGVDGQALLIALDESGIYASSGAACGGASLAPSPVLTAIGLAPEAAHSSLRFSLWPGLTDRDIDHAAAEIADAVRRLRGVG